MHSSAAHQEVRSITACLQGDEGALHEAGQARVQVLCLHALQAIIRGVLKEAPAQNAPSASALQSMLKRLAFQAACFPSRGRRMPSVLCLPAW